LLRFFLLSLLLFASIFAANAAGDEPQRFVLPLPEHWQESKVRLVLEGVRVPGNVPFKLRATAMGEDNKEVFLGSVGVEAIGPSHTETRQLQTLRLDVTRSLKRFLERQANPREVEIRIRAVDARNNPIQDLKWSVEAVRLEGKAVD
jgi:hypothetical protein